MRAINLKYPLKYQEIKGKNVRSFSKKRNYFLQLILFFLFQKIKEKGIKKSFFKSDLFLLFLNSLLGFLSEKAGVCWLLPLQCQLPINLFNNTFLNFKS